MTDELRKAELAAHRYDGLGMAMYRPHIAEMRQRVLGPNFNGVVQPIPERFSCEPVDEMLAATRETQGQPVDAEPRKTQERSR